MCQYRNDPRTFSKTNATVLSRAFESAFDNSAFLAISNVHHLRLEGVFNEEQRLLFWQIIEKHFPADPVLRKLEVSSYYTRGYGNDPVKGEMRAPPGDNAIPITVATSAVAQSSAEGSLPQSSAPTASSA